MANRLIHETAVHVDKETGELTSYWPEYWPLEKLAAECKSTDWVFFQASYNNNPVPLNGNILKSAWLMSYTHAELIEARSQAGVERGILSAGIDTASGGSGDSDYSAGIIIEKVGNWGFLRDMINIRVGLEKQAQILEDWLTLWMPDFVTIEDVASKGYVYTQFKTQVNDQRGTIHPVVIETAKGKNALGDKPTRFLAMGGRFQSGQIRIPAASNGEETTSGFSSKWLPFVYQWAGFPTGHDDILDATHWAQIRIFKDTPVAIWIRTEEGHTEGWTSGVGELMPQSEMLSAIPYCERGHYPERLLITDCPACKMNLSLAAGQDDKIVGSGRLSATHLTKQRRFSPRISPSYSRHKR